MTDFVMSKSGTLTNGNLRTTWLYFHKDNDQREAHKLVDDQNQISIPMLNAHVDETMANLIVLSSDATMEIDDKSCTFGAVGNPVEVGLLNYLTERNIDVH